MKIEKSGRWREMRWAKGGIKVDFPYFLSFFFKKWYIVEGVYKLWGESGGGRERLNNAQRGNKWRAKSLRRQDGIVSRTEMNR